MSPEPSASKTITLGKEYDAGLRTTLIDVLRELGAVSDRSWGVDGSQEVERLDFVVAGQTLRAEAETYIGLSIAGKPELVRRIAEFVRLKQKSPDLPIGQLDDLLRQLDVLEKSDRGPFPYKGCRWLRAVVHGDLEDLIPSLDLYLGDVAGYRRWGNH